MYAGEYDPTPVRRPMTCTAVTIWPEVPPHGVRLACCLPAGHDGEHACADVEYLADPEPTEPLKAPENATSQASGGFQPTPETRCGGEEIR